MASPASATAPALTATACKQARGIGATGGASQKGRWEGGARLARRSAVAARSAQGMAPAWAPSGGSGQCKARASLPARAALGSAPRTGAPSRSPRHTLHPKPLVLLQQQWKAQGWGSCSCPLQGQCCTCPGAPWDLAAFVTLLLCSDTGLASVLYSVSSAFAPHESRYRCAFAPAN